jgi:hypothetical protein
MPQLVDESTFGVYRQGMVDIRDTLGRKILISLPGIDRKCPNCSFDSINNSSTGLYVPEVPYPGGIAGPKAFKGRCPICKGTGRVRTSASQKKIKGIPNWLEGKDREVMVGTVSFEADLEVTNMALKYYDLISQCEYVVIDGLKLYLVTVPAKEGLRNLIKFSAFFKHGKKVGDHGA